MLTDMLQALGAGSTIVAATSLALVGWHMWRAAALGRIVASTASTALLISVSITFAAALALALGWVDPHPGVIIEHLRAALWFVIERGSAPLRALVRFLVGDAA